MGGLGNVELHPGPDRTQSWPGLIVWTDHPAVACMASQYAGWAISVGKFFAMGSGPLRAHARVERELFEKLGYEEQADDGVLVLETRRSRPTRWPPGLRRRPGCSRVQLTFVVAPTASLAGGVQISARIIETGLHKMETLGLRREAAWSARSGPHHCRRWPRTICAPLAEPTTAFCMAARPAIP